MFIIRKVFEGHDVQLSGGRSLGTLGIRGKHISPKLDKDGNITGVPPDWGTSRKVWQAEADKRGISLKEYLATTTVGVDRQIIYHLNEHTNGISYSIYWFKTKMNLPNKTYYSFVACKGFKRTVPKMIAQGKEYLVIHKKHFEDGIKS